MRDRHCSALLRVVISSWVLGGLSLIGGGIGGEIGEGWMPQSSALAQTSTAPATSSSTGSSSTGSSSIGTTYGSDSMTDLEPVSPAPAAPALRSTETSATSNLSNLQGWGQMSAPPMTMPADAVLTVPSQDTVPSSAATGSLRPGAPLRLPQRGPYYPALLDAALPFPEPIFPELAPNLRLVIRLSERRVYLYDRDDLQVSYPIAVGRAGWETPVGTYEIINMVTDPGWQNPFTGAVIPPGPSNPLGDRWIGFWTDGQNYIGFHGTPNESSVGRAASHGCIRMYNRDVRELFEKVAVGTPVVVEP